MFGAKRKARKIRVAEDNEDNAEPASATEEPMNDGKSPQNVMIQPVFFADGRNKTADARFSHSSRPKPVIRQVHSQTVQGLIAPEEHQR